MLTLIYEREGVLDIREFKNEKELNEWLNREIAMCNKYDMTFKIINLQHD